MISLSWILSRSLGSLLHLFETLTWTLKTCPVACGAPDNSPFPLSLSEEHGLFLEKSLFYCKMAGFLMGTCTPFELLELHKLCLLANTQQICEGPSLFLTRLLLNLPNSGTNSKSSLLH